MTEGFIKFNEFVKPDTRSVVSNLTNVLTRVNCARLHETRKKLKKTTRKHKKNNYSGLPVEMQLQKAIK